MKSRLLTALVATLLGALIGEAAFRLLEPRLGVDRERLARFRDFVTTGGETALYEPRPHVLYARPRGLPGVNSLGFSDDEPNMTKPPGVLRVACLGSSTTEGGNPQGREGSYPYFLKAAIEARLKQPVEVLNFGMSGWTSAEEMVHYFLVVQDYAPDVVVIHEAPNDVEPRNWPGFRRDYSHYRRPWRELRYSAPYRLLARWSDAFAAYASRDASVFGLQAVVVRPPDGAFGFANGTLPPETAAPFKRNVRTIADHVRWHGGRVLLATMPFDTARAETFPMFRAGLLDHNRILRELAVADGLVLVDLEALARRDPSPLRGMFLDLVHVTPQGNRWKAERIAEALAAWPTAP